MNLRSMWTLSALSLIPVLFTGVSATLGAGNSLWDPFRPWDPLADSTLGHLAHWPSVRHGEVAPLRATAMLGTNVDWRETDKEHIFKVDLPGLGNEAIDVQIEDGRTLRISGQYSKEETSETDTWHRVERTRGQFLRRFRLPENVDVEKITAEMEHGVLTVTVPKTDRPLPELHRINVALKDSGKQQTSKEPLPSQQKKDL